MEPSPQPSFLLFQSKSCRISPIKIYALSSLHFHQNLKKLSWYHVIYISITYFLYFSILYSVLSEALICFSTISYAEQFLKRIVCSIINKGLLQFIIFWSTKLIITKICTNQKFRNTKFYKFTIFFTILWILT